MRLTKSEAQYNLIDWWKKVVKDNYANFEGRARRAEYWNYTLLHLLITIGFYILALALVLSIVFSLLVFVLWALLFIYNMVILLPTLAVAVRRLHDTNKSGWLILLGIIPLVGGIILIVFLATEGDRGTNQYGADPKMAPDFIQEIGLKDFK